MISLNMKEYSSSPVEQIPSKCQITFIPQIAEC